MNRLALAVTLVCPVVAGCAKPSAPVTPPIEEAPVAIQAGREQPAPARRFTGTLRGGVIAIGAETTGWILETEEGRLDVDVSKAQDAAAELDGRRVVIDGDVVMTNWVERGKKRLLMADSIAPTD